VDNDLHPQRPSQIILHGHGLAGTPRGRSACLALRRGARRRGGASESWLRVSLVNQPVIVGEVIGSKDLGYLGFNRANGKPIRCDAVGEPGLFVLVSQWQ
jgi:hypothetical protein